MDLARTFVPQQRVYQEPMIQDEHLRLVGGGLEHRTRLDTGEAAWLSPYDGLPWIEREAIVLESQTAAASAGWNAVGGYRETRLEAGQSVREVGTDAATCTVAYEGAPEAPLKVRLRLKVGEAGRYRVRWSLGGPRGMATRETLAHGLRLEEAGHRCEVNWEDVLANYGAVVSAATGTEGAEVLFGPFDLGAGQELELDPTIDAVYDLSSVGVSNQRRLARTTDGTLYAVYINTDGSGNPRVYVKQSSDGGSSWTNETQVSGNYDAAYCALVSDNRDDLHVVYSGLGSGYSNYQVWYVRRKEGVWQTPVRISTYASMDSYAQYCPALTIDAADDLHVVWWGMASGYTSGTQIWWAACLRGAWQAPTRISTAANMSSYIQSYPALCADGKGGLHVAWNGKGTFEGSDYFTNDQVWYGECLNGVWQSPVRISIYSGMNSNSQGCPNIAYSIDGHVQVVWYGYATGYTSYLQIWYAERTASWQTPVRLSTLAGMDTNTQRYPQIAADSGGQLHVVWEGRASGAIDQIYRTTYDGSNWSSPSALTSSSQHRRANLRWASFHNWEGSLDWMSLAGAPISYTSGGDEDQTVTYDLAKAQSFKATETRQLSFVQLYVKNDGTSRTATCLIQSNSGGVPSGTTLGTATATVGSGSYGWVQFNFYTGGVNLSANTNYWIVLYPSAGTIYWQVDASSPAYADGKWASYVLGVWTADTSRDGLFYMYPFYGLEFGNDTAVIPADAALMTATSRYYDAAGRQLAVQDAMGKRTTTTYDEVGKVTAVRDPRGNQTAFTYYADGRRKEVVDARGGRTTFIHDPAGQLTLTKDPLNRWTTYAYDPVGRLWWQQDAKGQAVTYNYDPAGQVTHVDASDGTRVTFSYDNAGNRTQMQDSTGTTQYAVDALHRIKTLTYAGNKVLVYEYDAVGNRTKLTDADGGVTTYTYNSRNLISWMVNPRGERTTWVYDAVGRPTTMTHGNGALAEHDYNGAGWTQAVCNLKADRSVISIFTYTYDANGNRRGVGENSGDRMTWSYDAASQLTREQRSGGGAYDATYTYDAVGNRLTKVEAGVTTSYSYDAANQLNYEFTPSGRTTYTYDNNGNTTGINAAGSRTTQAWDVYDRMTVVQLAGGGRTTATYDGDGKRRSYADSGFRYFYWDGENVLFQTDVNGNTNRTYTLRPAAYGELISEDGNFHHYDALGSTTQVTDTSATVLVSYRYRAFGEQTIVSGSSPIRYTWLGKYEYYRQPDTSDYWVRARVYRPTIGRWLSRDSLMALNRYEYALSAPTVLVDLNGREAVRPLEQAAGPALRVIYKAPAPTWIGLAGRLLGPIGLLLTDPGNIVTQEEEERYIKAHPLPQRRPDDTQRRCECLKKHEDWPACRHDAQYSPQGAAFCPPETGPDPVNRQHWYPAAWPWVESGPVIEASRKDHQLNCPGRVHGVVKPKVLGGTRYVVAVYYTERDRRKWKSDIPENERTARYSIRCCPCCGPGGEAQDCKNLHLSQESRPSDKQGRTGFRLP